MLFYASLFVFCLVLSAVVLWLSRSLSKFAGTIYRSIRPGTNENSRQQERVNSGYPQNPTTVTGGWSDSPKRTGTRANPAAERWARRTASNEMAKFVRNNSPEPGVSNQLRPTGWPYRVESFEIGGRYKVVHGRKRKKSNLREMPKPWGW